MEHPPLKHWRSVAGPFALAMLMGARPSECPGSDLRGATVRLEGDAGGAIIDARPIDRFKIQVNLNAGGAPGPLAIAVELPTTGPHAWPVADVEVRDGLGQAVATRRPGIEWQRLTIPVPTTNAAYFVQAAPSARAPAALASDKDRTLADPATGIVLTVARWHDGRRAALSIRFDDSHATHLARAIPILDEYGFRGTFMVNPGEPEPGSRWRSSFLERLGQWENVARTGRHELANHSAHHRGAKGDDDMETEIGAAARAIWRLTPGRSQLMALNLGGGTTWETTRTLRYYLDKYHQFDASGNSTGMDDSYGDRVGHFRRMLEQHIERGLWLRIHYHAIGEERGSSEANFRAVLDLARDRGPDLWIAGMADIHKYQTERGAARLSLERSEPGRIVFRLSCAADPALYDQPLTLEAARPGTHPDAALTVRDATGAAITPRPARAGDRTVRRFDVAPRDATYSVETTR